MEILRPVQPQSSNSQTESKEPGPIPGDLQFTQNEIDAIKYLGVTDGIFDDETMSKVKEIVDYFKTGDIEAIDLKLGNPYGMSRLDKVYSYMRLSKQADDIRNRELVIEQAKSKFLTSQ